MKTMNPNDFGKKFLADKCQKISISKLLKKSRYKIKQYLLKSELEHKGIKMSFTNSRTGFGGKRIWFKCPMCSRRVEIIYINPSGNIGCRKCLNIDYRKHRYKGMIEAN